MGMIDLGKSSLFRQAHPLSGETGRKGLVLAGALSLCLFVTACARPTGDFERARPSVIHDTIMPAAGDLAANRRGEPVSKLNYTNDEKLLRDRGWTLIRPPWTKDWIAGTRVELSRTRILPETEGKIAPDLYYTYLRSDKFRSSDARYDKVASDAKGDAKLVWPFCEVALRVEEADKERLRSLASREITTEQLYAGAKARVWENRAIIKWVAQALRYRIKAYRIAVDSLEVETPSGNRVWQANTAIRELEAEVKLAEDGCKRDNRYGIVEAPQRSRIFTGWGTEKPPPKK